MIHRHTSSQNLQKEVSTVGSPEEPTHRTPTYDPIYGGGNWLRIEGIQKRQVISEDGESWCFSLKVVGREFLLHIQLWIIEDKQVKQASKAGCLGTSYAGMDWIYKDSGTNYPIARYANNSSALEFSRVLYPNLR